jgi:hypothetical protein
MKPGEWPVKTQEVLLEVAVERGRQIQLWGLFQDHPNGETYIVDRERLDRIRKVLKNESVPMTWRLILAEEMNEAFCELGDDHRLREELLQVAAVVVAWVEAIDRRSR